MVASVGDINQSCCAPSVSPCYLLGGCTACPRRTAIAMRGAACSFATQYRVQLAFNDTGTDILADILARIVARMSASRSACHRNNFRKSDASARILARMSVSVSASWNAGFSDAVITCYKLIVRTGNESPRGRVWIVEDDGEDDGNGQTDEQSNHCEHVATLHMSVCWRIHRL